MNELLNYGNEKQEIGSSCSIEAARGRKGAKCEQAMQCCEKEAAKSTKYISDRFLPVRSMKELTKDLFRTEEGSGELLQEIYKAQILGEHPHKNEHIASFCNENFLQYSHKSIDEQQQLFTKGLLCEETAYPTKQEKRKINKAPAKVLDAPSLYDDFYLNLVDWSASNLLAVGLANSVYLWNAGNSKVVRLVELSATDMITSTSSSPSSNVLGVGTQVGEVQLWDCVKHRKVTTFKEHTARVGALAWNSNNVLASGSRDKNILVRDTRMAQVVQKMVGHKQEVCGLKWSFDQQQLASGGNDNRLNLWTQHSPTPTYSLLKHTAAVKALAWSPHQHGLLVSGGGTADRTIRFWNTVLGEETKCVDVGSQVCNLLFARTVNELVSTHGFSLNQINVWKMPKMQKIQTLTGHTYRVLYLAMNPDGTTIVTGAGDQTLRFWNIFPKKEKETRIKSSLTHQSICLR